MGKSSPSYPQPPSPAATAAAQYQYNRDAAQDTADINRLNEFTPYGSSVYEQIGETPSGIAQYKRTSALSPGQQKIFDRQTDLYGDLGDLATDQLGRVSANLAEPYSYEGLPDAPLADSDARQESIDALYGQYKSRLDPRFKESGDALETRLATQGIGIGSDAYMKAMGIQSRDRNDAYQTALNNAIAAGGAEQSRLFGLQGSARTRAIQEYAAQRNAPLNEAAALMSGANINNPRFSGAPAVSISPPSLTNATNAQYNAQLAQYNQNQNRRAANLGGLYGLAGSGIKAAGAAQGVSNLFT
jgi:hypothetical protein